MLSAILAGCESNNNQTFSLVSIQIVPAENAARSLSLVPGNTQQYIARGSFSDGTTTNITNSVSEDAAVVAVNDSGEVTAVAPGSTRIFASLNGFVSNRASITVSGVVLTSIELPP
ncbi:Ig-like domain-containing protein [uncultured Microbulbifer sp.]|uniref:Ig-like domain-containing protein n=1 Tax=uncultured Microbulbifer sp. TaxID=348147 RepID=UPI00260A81C7|nr:Ig-like domain-containing protein [uncultured Microbulbifer sp.]